jgi:Uma2 family endonuclease
VADLAAFPDDGPRYELLQGHLLVTPQPGSPHQFLAAELTAWLVGYLGAAARVASPGVVEQSPDIHLEPDILVVPTPLPERMEWADFRDHWLAVEIYSRSSRRYDHDYKRDAYLALGVREVWLVDRLERAILVSTPSEKDRRVTGLLRWQPPEMERPLELELERVFRGV